MDEQQVQSLIDTCMQRWGRIDILHNNVGISVAGKDAAVEDITPKLRSYRRCQPAGYGLQLQAYHSDYAPAASGAIVNISSIAAWSTYPWSATRRRKRSDRLDAANSHPERALWRSRQRHPPWPHGYADGGRHSSADWGRAREAIAAERDAQVPLRQKMGTAWDVAYAALFLASDEANFITGWRCPSMGG